MEPTEKPVDPDSESSGSLVTLSQRCLAIDLLILDVDGVLTAGDISYGDVGLELKAFHVRDGSGLKIWRFVGRRAAIISGRNSSMVERRAQELGIDLVIQGATDKLPALQQLLAQTALRPSQVGFIGDDLPDLPILGQVGLAVAVADACPEVLAQAHYVTQAAGGRGAVRETIELILRCQGEWQKTVAHFRSQEL
ncbi:MAG: HAD hydrolase family protein [Gemmataceae bacterium]|nr:HAD hydrolase family protein [Gemmataceae bacterium]